jgi:hypothetical protein
MTETTFSVSESAAKRIAFLASKEAKPVMMRGGALPAAIRITTPPSVNASAITANRSSASSAGKRSSSSAAAGSRSSNAPMSS